MLMWRHCNVYVNEFLIAKAWKSMQHPNLISDHIEIKVSPITLSFTYNWATLSSTWCRESKLSIYVEKYHTLWPVDKLQITISHFLWTAHDKMRIGKEFKCQLNCSEWHLFISKMHCSIFLSIMKFGHSFHLYHIKACVQYHMYKIAASLLGIYSNTWFWIKMLEYQLPKLSAPKGLTNIC